MTDRGTPDVIALAALGPKVGLGHAMRAQSVLRAFAETGAHTELVLQWRGDHKARAAMVSRFAEGTRCLLLEDLDEALTHQPAALLLTDLPEAHALPFSRIRRTRRNPVVCLNAYAIPDEAPDIAFLRGIHWEQHCNAAHPWVAGGASFEIIAPRVRAQRPARAWQGSTIRRILLTCGAADPGEITEASVPALAAHADEVTVIAGPLFEPERLRRLRNTRFRNVRVVDAPDNLADDMLQADLVVSLGGQTTWEAMCLGRPVALLRWAPTSRAAAYFVRSGAALDLGHPSEIGDLAPAALSDVDPLRAQAARNFRIVDGDGASRTVDWIRRRYSRT